MKRYEISLPSSDGVTTLHGFRWDPDGDARAVVQLVHGMEEYIERYDEFARFLADQGIAVIGHDHLGHGGSITDESELGYFAKENNFAYKWMVEQMKQRIGEPPLPQITLPVWAWYQYSSRKKNKPPLSPIDKGHDGKEMMMEILCTTTSKNPKHPSHALVR